MSRAPDLGGKVRKEWESAASGWRKWDPHLMRWLEPVGAKILDLAELRDDDVVLDVATGSGEPGLSAAKRLKRGRVVGIDVSEAMTSTAREKAQRLGVTNYEARTYGGVEFPFGPESFDAVVCRFGAMFFPDVLAGLREMVRVAKPGRKVCVAVWGPQNRTAKAAMQVLDRELRLPETALDSPNPFRCSESGKVESLLRQAGLRDVGLAEVPTVRYYDSSERYWEYLMDMNPDVAAEFGKANLQAKERARRGVFDTLDSVKREGGRIELASVAWVGHGVRQAPQ